MVELLSSGTLQAYMVQTWLSSLFGFGPLSILGMNQAIHLFFKDVLITPYCVPALCWSLRHKVKQDIVLVLRAHCCVESFALPVPLAQCPGNPLPEATHMSNIPLAGLALSGPDILLTLSLLSY